MLRKIICIMIHGLKLWNKLIKKFTRCITETRLVKAVLRPLILVLE